MQNRCVWNRLISCGVHIYVFGFRFIYFSTPWLIVEIHRVEWGVKEQWFDSTSGGSIVRGDTSSGPMLQ